MKEFIASYLAFTKKERTGIITLLLIIFALILTPFTYSFFIPQPNIDSRQFEKEIAAIKIKTAGSDQTYAKKEFDENEYSNHYVPYQKNYSPTFTGQLFTFDPNTLSPEGWKKLGLKEKTIQTIQKYLSKGGKFYKPEDISKIWGLQPSEAERLQPYIEIQQKETVNFENKKFEKTVYTPPIIDINQADTSTLIALPGIGSKLAQRIITFREKLGGFYKPEQVAETFGLPDSIYQKIKTRVTINNTAIRQININTATIDELKIHPYIRYNIGNLIIQYRNQHGNFNTIEDIKKIMLIDEGTYNKIHRYLKVSSN
ncbi:MAG: helix-hairpin-helix domain-containing protein [Chitinophagaceae bacterium]|nr:helix-hairpin-helix domain-containing protein [Chitinophagaceae bacterium]